MYSTFRPKSKLPFAASNCSPVCSSRARQRSCQAALFFPFLLYITPVRPSLLVGSAAHGSANDQHASSVRYLLPEREVSFGRWPILHEVSSQGAVVSPDTVLLLEFFDEAYIARLPEKTQLVLRIALARRRVTRNGIGHVAHYVRSDPWDPWAWSDLGDLFWIKGDTELAFHCFKMGIQVGAAPDLHLRVGALHFAEGRLLEALDTLTSGLMLHRGNSHIGFAIACVAAAMGNRRLAISVMEAVTKLQPDLELAKQCASLPQEPRPHSPRTLLRSLAHPGGRPILHQSSEECPPSSWSPFLSSPPSRRSPAHRLPVSDPPPLALDRVQACPRSFSPRLSTPLSPLPPPHASLLGPLLPLLLLLLLLRSHRIALHRARGGESAGAASPPPPGEKMDWKEGERKGTAPTPCVMYCPRTPTECDPVERAEDAL
mmetsp:Transcript_40011/g.95078  ORF Transcript_40011/g.95078 Transcript_40011/m.95078 type:complete len:430 (-) Transcript_40011:870-2159(-)